jgi:hypothetical protein
MKGQKQDHEGDLPIVDSYSLQHKVQLNKHIRVRHVLIPSEIQVAAQLLIQHLAEFHERTEARARRRFSNCR